MMSGMKKERTKQKSIENIVKDVIKNLSGAGRVSEEEVFGAWVAAAGEKAAKHTRPVSIKKGVMTVNIDGSGWLYELTVKKKELLKKLDGKIKGKQVKALRFRIGEIK
jgi:predicted nucleic acid-binding Zn ribbon protein